MEVCVNRVRVLTHYRGRSPRSMQVFEGRIVWRGLHLSAQREMSTVTHLEWRGKGATIGKKKDSWYEEEWARMARGASGAA